MQDKITTFKRLAKENYDKSMGWSVFTECYDDSDIAEFVADLDSPEAVADMMATVASVDDDRYANAKNEAF